MTTLPDGIPSKACTLGPVVDYNLANPQGAKLSGVLYCDRAIVHEASGWRFSPSDKGVALSNPTYGGELSFAVPPSDAEGFIDAESGQPVTMWLFTFVGWAEWPDGSREKIRSVFQPLTADAAPFDLDLHGGGPPQPTETIPREYVTSVVGAKGDVSASQIAAALSLAQVLTAAQNSGTDLALIEQLTTQAFGRSVLEVANAAALRTLAGIASASTSAEGLVELATTLEATTGTDTTRAVTPAGLKAALDALVAGAPGALDTLAELAAALGNDANFATTITNALAGKAGKTEAYKQLARNPDVLISGAITRDANGAATSAAVVWPDGTPGTYTATTVSTAFPGAVDAYTITYGSPVTATYTQAAVTRNASGAVTNAPAIAVA